MIVYYNGDYIEKDKVCISPDDRGFLFGDGTYEVIHVYQKRIFRIQDHLKRLKRSLHEIEMGHVDVTVLKEVGETLILKNPQIGDNASMYIQITRGVAPRNHFIPADIQPTIYASLSESMTETKIHTQGVKIILVPDQRWGRCDIKSIALLANVLAAREAQKQNAYESVFVRNGKITEGTRTNIAVVFDGTIYTHPLNTHILGGITRDVVLELCASLHLPVIQKSVSDSQLLKADEVFLMGTTTEIAPVIQVNDSIIQDGKPGPVTQNLQQAFREIVLKS